MSCTNFYSQKNKRSKKNKSETTNSQILPSSKIDSVSYAIGISIAKSFETEFPEINLDQFMYGLSSKLSKEGETIMNDTDAQKIVENYFKSKKEASMSQEKDNYSSVIKEGEDFLIKNAKRKNIITLASGLQYEILTKGNGAKPGPTDKIEAHYHGTLLDGTVFDSSVERGTPIALSVNGVIKGWTEALQLMSVGSKWKLFIPYNLAYGERGAGALIKPYSTLIFEVELISIN
ncbi:MAG: FKBP-type peptidyl-prolyl cis-trans isomerase [Flavobacteriales bacterium]|jgi:FKBP-type peptidyl-prolyl cis-trans isomerase FklB|nr:FKBP-type peptidyl-prolyl cis-trans isomerase [Flavobacteriales bacterium]